MTNIRTTWGDLAEDLTEVTLYTAASLGDSYADTYRPSSLPASSNTRDDTLCDEAIARVLVSNSETAPQAGL